MTKDEMVGWHHRLDGHESEQTPGEGEGQGSLMCCSPWSHKESGKTEGKTEQQQQLIYNVVLLSAAQERGSVTHTYIHSFF